MYLVKILKKMYFECVILVCKELYFFRSKYWNIVKKKNVIKPAAIETADGLTERPTSAFTLLIEIDRLRCRFFFTLK